MHAATAARLTALPALVTRAHLRAAKVDLDVARRAVAAGLWCDVLPGAWLRRAGPATRRDRQEAALALLGGAAALTGADACAAYGLRDVPDDGRVAVLVDHRVRRDLGPQVRLVRSTRAAQTHLQGGLRVVEPGRAVLDAADGASLRDVRALVMAAVGDAWCDAQDLRTCLDAGPRAGSGRLRRALDDHDDGARSAPEAEVADALAAAVRRGRLPPYLLNADLELHGQLLATPDVYLPGLGLGQETDSRRHHGSEQDLDATLQRHERVADGGILLLHVSPTRFRADPAAYVDVVCWRAAERRALAVPEPPGLVVRPRGPLLPVAGRRGR